MTVINDSRTVIYVIYHISCTPFISSQCESVLAFIYGCVALLHSQEALFKAGMPLPYFHLIVLYKRYRH